MRPSLLVSKAPRPSLSASYNNQCLAKPALQKTSYITPRSQTQFPDASAQNTTESNGATPSLSIMMPPSPPNDGDLNLGDLVDVPGKMHGIVRFIGTVNNKKGVFAGVELSEEFASRGKNSGDVEGVSYFTTSIPGAGIFLPVNRATRLTSSPTLRHGSLPLTPTTPIAGGLKNLGYGFHTNTPPTVPKFHQSVGNERISSPHGKKIARSSLSRPGSPVRTTQLSSIPSFGPSAVKTPARYGSPAPKRFGQSVRGTQDSRDSSKRIRSSPQKGMKGGPGARSASALGHSVHNLSEDELTPITKQPPDHSNPRKSSISSINDRMRTVSRPASRAANKYDENQHLRSQLEERDRRLQEQAYSLAEMENALAEVQSLMENDTARNKNRGSMEGKDVFQLRAMLREKNDKIAMLTAEFDAHRADFRSTIDTLELASNETERVYEQRISDLLKENRELSERTEDVDSVARQLKQLEEFVQELEDGLEDARRGEAEARGEVEFLRGEVERTRSELNREREKAASAITAGNNGTNGLATRVLEHRDDEIRGLKAIIHSLSRDSISGMNHDAAVRRSSRPQHVMSNSFGSLEARLDIEKLGQKFNEYQAASVTKGKSEEKRERESENICRESLVSTGTATHENSTVRNSKGTIASWHDRDSRSSIDPQRRAKVAEQLPDSDACSSANESFCELCETPGHDILICTNIFTSNTKPPPVSEKKDTVTSHDDYKAAPLSPNKSPIISPVQNIPNPIESGPVAGKESGVINIDKWCGVCENEGHDSIDCPFEDAF